MKVLAPWTNMKVTEKENAFIVDVWGRTYTFENNLFPTSILTQGQELLSGPIALKMDFGYGEQMPYNYQYRVLEAENDKVVVASAALCGNLIINAAVTLEFDGFMKIALRLIPCFTHQIKDWRDEWATNEDVMLQRARLSIPMKKEKSSLIHVYPLEVMNDIGQAKTSSSGYFVSRNYRFKGSVWMGNENVGLNFCMETDENIQLVNKDECITTTCGEEANEFSIQLLNKVPKQWKDRQNTWMSAVEPISYEFILEATPVKPLTREVLDDWRVCLLRSSGEGLEEAAQMGAKWVYFHDEWNLMQNYKYPANESEIKAVLEKAHALGLKVMPYFGYEYATAMVDWEKNHKNYLTKTADGTFYGGWTRSDIHQRDYVVCYNGGYSQEKLGAVKHVLDDIGFDGIYTDGTYVPFGCANENHGCGYRDENGELHVTYPILALREHVKKLYEIVHERGGRVDAHQSACIVIPVLAFADSYWDGENLQEAMSKDMEGSLSLESFRTEFYGKNLGVTPQLIAMLDPPAYTMRNVLSISMLHDVLPRPLCGTDMKELEIISKVWNAYDQFCVSAAQWKPYWENTSSVKTDNAKVYISSYEKEDEALAFVSLFGDDAEVELQVPAHCTKAYEYFDGKEYPVVNGKIQLPMKRATIYMLRIS